jgi:hypothetical protein
MILAKDMKGCDKEILGIKKPAAEFETVGNFQRMLMNKNDDYNILPSTKIVNERICL